jgi:hypothetical protein
MGGSEVASECSISREEVTSASTAIVIVRYGVIGKIVENQDGSKRLIRVNVRENVPLHLSFLNGSWKIDKKSLMHVAEHAKPEVWADHFEKLIEADDQKKSVLDHKMIEFVTELRKM